MKRLSNIKRCNTLLLILLLFFVNNIKCHSQATSAGAINSPQFGTVDFLGWDATVNNNVNIRHFTAGEPIIFGTDNTERMRLTPNRRLLVNTQNIDC